jgi:hypothetical protein
MMDAQDVLMLLVMTVPTWVLAAAALISLICSGA